MTAGIVAWRDHPLFAGTVVPQDLARYPWIDFDWPAPASLDKPPQPGQMHRTPHIHGILATLQTTTRPARTSRISVFPGWGLTRSIHDGLIVSSDFARAGAFVRPLHGAGI